MSRKCMEYLSLAFALAVSTGVQSASILHDGSGCAEIGGTWHEPSATCTIASSVTEELWLIGNIGLVCDQKERPRDDLVTIQGPGSGVGIRTYSGALIAGCRVSGWTDGLNAFNNQGGDETVFVDDAVFEGNDRYDIACLDRDMLVQDTTFDCLVNASTGLGVCPLVSYIDFDCGGSVVDSTINGSEYGLVFSGSEGARVQNTRVSAENGIYGEDLSDVDFFNVELYQPLGDPECTWGECWPLGLEEDPLCEDPGCPVRGTGAIISDSEDIVLDQVKASGKELSIWGRNMTALEVRKCLINNSEIPVQLSANIDEASVTDCIFNNSKAIQVGQEEPQQIINNVMIARNKHNGSGEASDNPARNFALAVTNLSEDPLDFDLSWVGNSVHGVQNGALIEGPNEGLQMGLNKIWNLEGNYFYSEFPFEVGVIVETDEGEIEVGNYYGPGSCIVPQYDTFWGKQINGIPFAGVDVTDDNALKTPLPEWPDLDALRDVFFADSNKIKKKICK